MTSRTDVFDHWYNTQFLHGPGNGKMIIVTMSCHMAVSGQNIVTSAVLDIGRGTEYTWVANAVKTFKPRMVMGLSGRRLETVVNALRTPQQLQVSRRGRAPDGRS